MATVSISPYFKAKEGKLEELKALCPALVELVSKEDLCTYFGFAFDGDTMFVREAYEGAAGVLAHLENAGEALGPVFEAADLIKLEVVATAEDIEALKEPLKDLNPTYFTLEFGA